MTITDHDTVADAPRPPGVAAPDRPATRSTTPSAYSTLDVLWVLYDRVLRVTPETVDDPDRDRFLLSKGHGAGRLLRGTGRQGLPPRRLARRPGRAGQPARPPPGPHAGPRRGDRLRLARARPRPGRRHRARAARPGPLEPRVYVLLGDAELDEGSNHEAIAYAGATGLDTSPRSWSTTPRPRHGWPGGIATRFTVNGWTAATVDGRDHDALARAR